MNNMMDDQQNILSLLHKYDVPIPRYTSYPTVPYWEPNTINQDTWLQVVNNTFTAENNELCVYVHLPFCENLCTFCACNKRITKNHDRETPYIESLLKEWKIYRDNLPTIPVIREIHFGGGTPTFFSAENLIKLVEGITKDAIVQDDHEFSVEVHPNFTTEKHIKALASVGFNRISMGVQDFDPEVQYVINRIQPFGRTQEVVDWALKYNYKSINIDLVYGLPKQTVSSVDYTIRKISLLKPDRIAFYSYAHVPWKSKVQRRYTDQDLPNATEKWNMYHLGRSMLMESGFIPIGMDHFALPGDKLFESASHGKLHRNFMGYTTTQCKLIIGLGASSISDGWNGFVQNEKEVELYEEKVNTGVLPIVHGHLLTEEDLIIRQNILDLMCRNETIIDENVLQADLVQSIMARMKIFESDELIIRENNYIEVTDKGKTFIRNIASALDARLLRNEAKGNTFSKAI
jgi:oxygen-independent coproporphyrinogen III oxidase